MKLEEAAKVDSRAVPVGEQAAEHEDDLPVDGSIDCSGFEATGEDHGGAATEGGEDAEGEKGAALAQGGFAFGGDENEGGVGGCARRGQRRG